MKPKPKREWLAVNFTPPLHLYPTIGRGDSVRVSLCLDSVEMAEELSPMHGVECCKRCYAVIFGAHPTRLQKGTSDAA